MKYNFLKKRDLNTKEIIERFNYQIEEEIEQEIEQEIFKENCKSYWEKKLFIETLNLTIDDWKEIRVGDYFKIKDSLSGIDQNKFILSRVMNYVLSKELTIILEK
tara:strand:+ start:402 stop:716 length:315 start_codon:yes stop_codon:yes gene_type:complete